VTNDVVPVEQPSSAILQVIERAAANPDIDVEKMERLFALQERMLTRNAELAFNESMRAAQEEMPKIYRNKENKQTNSYYADLERIADAAVPCYTKHGFSLSYGTEDCPIAGSLRVPCLVSHVAGHSRTYKADVALDLTGMKGAANKPATHGFGSTMSYARRYLVLMIFNLTLTNEDNDGNDDPPEAPSDYDRWKADMTALADEGIERLQAGWKRSATDLRAYATTSDAQWWGSTKAKAAKVQA